MEILLNLLKFACLVPLHVPTIYSKEMKNRPRWVHSDTVLLYSFQSRFYSVRIV